MAQHYVTYGSFILLLDEFPTGTRMVTAAQIQVEQSANIVYNISQMAFIGAARWQHPQFQHLACWAVMAY